MTFYVYRNNRNTVANLRNAVTQFFYPSGLICFDYRNTFASNPETIVNHFLWIHQMSGKKLHILFHRFSIDFDDLKDYSQIERISKQFLDYLGLHFPVMLSIIVDTDDRYKAFILINAISKDGRSTFQDRNSIFKDLIIMLSDISGQHVDVVLDNCVMFRNIDNNSGNYISHERRWRHDGLFEIVGQAC